MPVSRLMLVLVVVACALLGAASPTNASSGGLKVLVTGTCDQAAMATAIQAQPGVASATPYDVSAGTPTPTQLSAVDLVVSIGDTCNGGYFDAAAYGDRLADYADHGGAVLQAAYDNWTSTAAHPAGRFASGGYAPLSLGPNDNDSTTLGQILKPHSPIVQGLGTFATGDNTTTPLAAGATLLAKWADGRNAIAVKGRVVATSASPGDSSTLPDLARLAVNTGTYFHAIPDTAITDTTIDLTAHTVVFRFKAIGVSLGFKCKFAKAGKSASFKPCPSHKKYRNVTSGTYRFQVEAVGPGGADPTPAKTTLRISP